MPFLSKLTKRLALSAFAAGLGAAIVACAGDAPNPLDSDAPSPFRASSTAASITISPSSAAGTLGQSAQFTATVYDVRGRVLSGKTIIWKSSDSTVAEITASGYATGIGVGHAALIASTDGVTAQAPVSVDGVAITSISLDPPAASGVVGDSAQFRATVRDANGNVLAGRRVLWASSAPGVVAVDTTGMARAIAPGSATLTATSGGITGSAATTVTGGGATGATPPAVASVVVNPSSASGNVGDAAQFSATAYDAGGNIMSGQTVAWSSTNASVVTVSSTGYATAVGGGSASLVATIGGKSGTSAITVAGGTSGGTSGGTGGTPTSQTVSPAAASLVVGATQQISVSVTDALGVSVGGLVTSWSSSNTAVASVNASGLVTAVGAGSATITANTAGLLSTSLITVANAVSGGGSAAGWPNAPTSWPVLADQPFDAITSLGWTLTSNHYTSIAQDAGSPYSPGGVLQFLYPIGFVAGQAPGTEYTALPGVRHIYGGVWWKPSSPWQGDISNVNKLMFLQGGEGVGGMCIMMYGVPGGPYELRVANEFINADSRFFFPANVAHIPVVLGQWHRVEWQVEFSSPGASDGTIRFWLDGQLVGDYHDFKGPSGTMIEYQISPTFGGGGTIKAENDYFWFDHAFIKGY